MIALPILWRAYIVQALLNIARVYVRQCERTCLCAVQMPDAPRHLIRREGLGELLQVDFGHGGFLQSLAGKSSALPKKTRPHSQATMRFPLVSQISTSRCLRSNCASRPMP